VEDRGVKTGCIHHQPVEDGKTGPKTMNREIEASDPLAWAIGKFREELLLWIDTELDRLQEREQAADSVMEGQLLGASDLRPPLSNPRQRLDALARLLDDRLKQVQRTAEMSGGAANGNRTAAG
jgi:hypothetical protein